VNNLENIIKRVSDLRLTMWPESDDFNIMEADHLFGTLLEEAGEFRGAMRSFLGRPFCPEKKASKEHMIEELGDILVPIVALSHMTGISFSEALQFAETKLTIRKHNKDNDLRLQHIMEKDAQ
jgi:NTP pyrophosphatase (non-canonical NTP hydrolase)